MPAPQKSVLAGLTKMNFISKNIKLPSDWKDMGEQFPDSFTENERNVAPNSPMNLFREATLNKYHVDMAKDMGKKFERYMDGVCGAVCDAIDKWMKMTTIAGIIINGPVGRLLPGGVAGPPINPLILAGAPQGTPKEAAYSGAIANALSRAWGAWQIGLTGTLMYPLFAAFPGPMGPPTPNVALPLMAFSSAGESGLFPAALKSSMEGNLAEPNAAHASELFDSIATAFSAVFQTFKMSTIITGVLGTGPVPTFAPPFVSSGPVVAGSVIPTPGVLQ